MPLRLVSTTCSNTEIVCALGLEKSLVGVDRHSDYPPEVIGALPKVGPDLGIDVEAVAELKPDWVLASLTVPGHEKVVEALERAGLPVVVIAPTRLEHLYRDIRRIGELCGVAARADSLASELEREVEALTAPEVEARPKVLVEWWPKPVIVPGRKSWVTDLLDRAGGLNPWADRNEESLTVEPDEVRRARPDAVVISWCGVDYRKYRSAEVYKRAWQGVPAFERRQVFTVPEAFLGRPGPRLVEGLRELRRVVQEVVRKSDGPNTDDPISS